MIGQSFEDIARSMMPSPQTDQKDLWSPKIGDGNWVEYKGTKYMGRTEDNDGVKVYANWFELHFMGHTRTSRS
jgi:hypothetical protein